jgi:8-oxo-dGTP diphosphatase
MSAEKQLQNINTRIMGLSSYFKSAISVDCVIFGYDKVNQSIQVLTLECDMQPYQGMPSLVGDLVNESEDIDAAASRIVRERANISDVFLHQVHTFGAVHRHPKGRVISIAYYAFVQLEDVKSSNKNPHHPHWEPLSELKNTSLAFDHSKILSHSLKHIQSNILDVPIEYMLRESFTLSELQSLYEAILQKTLDKRNFRKKVFKLELIEKTTQTQRNVAHRPAQLYKFNRTRKGQNIL